MSKSFSKKGIRSFPRNYWTSVFMEFIERGSYYGMFSILAVYLVLGNNEGGLGFSRAAAGAVLGVIPPLLYLLPIFSGALAERFGYKKIFMFAFSFMAIGYFMAGCFKSYELIFGSLVVMAIGTGFFKPVISGTIALSTNEENSSLGFGIFYWAINLGAFLFPLILVPVLKQHSYSYVFWMASFGAVILLLFNIFLYKEPAHARVSVPFSKVFKDMILVLEDWRFMLMIVLYSGFWIMYFQMYGSVLWYLHDHVDMSPVNNAVNGFLSHFTSEPAGWKFGAEHVTVLNAGVIILLQLVVSDFVARFKALPTIITGIFLATAGMLILAVSDQAYVFIIACVVFTFGEMTAHPKFNSFVGLIAPKDKKALYMGYSFFCSVIGSFVGGFIGAPLYTHFIDNMGKPSYMWITCSGFGLVSITGLALYKHYIKR